MTLRSSAFPVFGTEDLMLTPLDSRFSDLPELNARLADDLTDRLAVVDFQPLVSGQLQSLRVETK